MEQDLDIIRGVLMLAKDGMDMVELTNKYREHVGDFIPHRKFGFSKLEPFLASIPHVVKLSQRRGRTIAEVVVDSDTAHVSKMVRETKSSSGAFGGRRGGYRAPPPRPPVVPNYLQESILDLLRRNMQGIELGTFQSRFLRQYNEPLDFKPYGFPDLRSLFAAMNCDVVIKPSGHKKLPFVFPRQHRIDEWKKAEKSASLPDKIPSDVKENLKSLIEEFPDGLEATKLPAKYLSKYGQELTIDQLGFQTVFEMATKLSEIFRVKKTDAPYKGTSFIYPAGDRPAKTDRRGQSKKEVSDDYKKNIEAVLLRYPGGVTASKFSEYYKEEFGTDLPGAGPESIEKMMNRLDFVEATSDDGGTLFRLSSERRKMAEKCVEKDLQRARLLSSAKKYVVVFANIHEDLTEDGLRCLFVQLNGSFLSCEIFDDTAEVVVDNLALAERAVDDFDGGVYEEKVISVRYYPAETYDRQAARIEMLNKEMRIPDQKLPPGLKASDDIEVLVAQIDDPHHFWVQLKENAGRLNELMNEMDDFYSDGDGATKAYDFGSDYAVEGVYCAAQYDGFWHRAHITKSVSKERVSIVYIDYGTEKSNVNLEDIRHLCNKFAKFPAQAIRARLADISPNPALGSAWSEAATRCFLRWVHRTGDCGLVAYIRGLSYLQQNCLVVWLHDTVTNDCENGIQINNTLVQEGLAIADQFNDENNPALRDKMGAEVFPKNIEKTPSYPPLRRPKSTILAADERFPTADHLPMVTNEILTTTPSQLKRPLATTFDSCSSAFVPFQNGRATEQVNGHMASPNTSRLIKIPSVCSSEFEMDRNAIKAVRLTEHHVVHVVNVANEPYLISADVSSLFPAWKNRDEVTYMLGLKNANFDALMATPDKHEALFVQCKLQDARGVGDFPKDLVLYKMADVPKILDLLRNHKYGTGFKAAIERELSDFDPSDPYWTRSILEEL